MLTIHQGVLTVLTGCSMAGLPCYNCNGWLGIKHQVTYLLHGWCHRKLLPSWCMFCVHHTTMHQLTMSLHLKACMLGACMFSCNLPPALLAEWLESFTCYYSNLGWNDDRNMSQHRKLTLENKMLLLGLKPATFRPQIQRSATDWAIPMFYALCTACKQSHEHIVCTLRALSDSSWGHPVQLTRCKNPRTV